MCVAEEVFGEGDHIGVLVRDRFPGYDNSFKGKQQFRCAAPVAKLTEALDAYAMDPGICIPDLLFPLPTHKAELSR